MLDDLFRFSCRLERDPERARDLLQQALLRGFRQFSQLENRGSFRAWITAIVRRTFLNLRRRKREEHPFQDIEETTLAGPESSFPDPERSLLARRLSRELRAALDTLPEEQRLAVFLIDVQEFSYAEAAAALEVPPGTVASRVARGRAALRRSLRHLARERGWIEP